MAVSKIPKWGTSQAGDTVEVVERPRGGLSAIMADGQGSGPSARRISNIVVHKAMSLIADGARDGAVGRAVHDHLQTLRGAQILCTLTIISMDLDTGTMVVSQNGNAPVVVMAPAGERVLVSEVPSIGVHSWIKPEVHELELEPGLLAAAFTDGITKAGTRSGNPLGLESVSALARRFKAHRARDLADGILEEALVRDRGRPADDMTVVAVGLSETPGENQIRRMSISMPVRSVDLA